MPFCNFPSAALLSRDYRAARSPYPGADLAVSGRGLAAKSALAPTRFQKRARALSRETAGARIDPPLESARER